MIYKDIKLTFLFSLLLLLEVAIQNAAADPHKRPFRSVKAPRQTVEAYEIVYPVVKDSRENEEIPDSTQQPLYPSEIAVNISTAATSYVLLLTKNSEFMSDEFSSICVEEDGEGVDPHHYSNCYYQGSVIGHPAWAATMSTCHGLRGEFGDLKDPQNLYNIEPANKSDLSLTAKHHIFLESEYEHHEGKCGMSSDEPASGHTQEVISKQHRVRRQATEQSAPQRYMEWVLVNDVAQFNSFDSLEETVERALTIANAVDLIYRPLGIQVKVTKVITLTNGTQFQRFRYYYSHYLRGIYPNLNEFTDYVKSELVPSGVQFDSAMLLTGHYKSYNTLGASHAGKMCERHLATAYSWDGGRSISDAISITAHELGHLFNMRHDDGRGCACADTTCVMQARLRFPPPTIFSRCSISDLQELYNRGGDRCLFNNETAIQVCGNGVVEENEDCDCGPAEFCKDSCCNATTCQFVEGPGRCSSGACCTDQCTLKSYGSECRASGGECDVAEFCTGDSSECPADVYEPNGISCKSDTGYCLNGQCPTHEDQCNYLFRWSGTGIQPCFELNAIGDIYGYCAQINSSSFLPCDESDILCGKLQCQAGSFRYNQGSRVNTTFIALPEGNCRSLRLEDEPTSLEDLDVGIVLEGTKCGDGMVCASRECVPLSPLGSCPRGVNGLECSGPANGVCNSEQECSCNVGFLGTACETIHPDYVNECLVDNGGCAHNCTDIIGSFECSCSSGYTLASDNINCEDVNECVDDVESPCSHICTNQVGSFQCSCYPGFYLDSNGRTCHDVDECLVDNGGCPEGCINEIGTFICSCHIGYTFASDNITCEDVDECRIDNGGCDQTCTNEVGSFECSCDSGYILDTDARTCNDVDECLIDNGGCNQRCTNQHGSFECSCNQGYILDSDNRTCIDVDECASGNGGCDQTCTNTIGSFQCSCAAGYIQENDDPRCLIGPCGQAGFEPGCCIHELDICRVGSCYCDTYCHGLQDCCSDVPPLSQLTCG